MKKTCANCQQEFQITDQDLAWLDRISPVLKGKKYPIPPSDLCDGCGHINRTAFRNERHLYQRKCDLTGKQIVSIFSPDKPYIVYDQHEWWGDKWDALEYGRDYDFNKPFFEQFDELMHKVPFLSNMVFNSTNCDYNGFCVDSKDCYMSARVGDSENVIYSYLSAHSTGCADCYSIFKCQYCYECVDCWNCYNSAHCQLCKNCTDCNFCYDCNGCKSCLGCVGLRNVEYHFFNKKCTKEEYQKLVDEYNPGSQKSLQEIQQKFAQEKLKHPVRATVITNAEDATGDYITNSKNIDNCFDVEETDTAKDSWGIEYSKDVLSSDFIYYGENCYQHISNSKSSNIFFTFVAIGGVHNVWYSMNCFNNTHDCFGCVGLKQKKYCILNKQYTKEEYEEILPTIIEHMIETNEWGKFFPTNLSTFGYNESVAATYLPLAKDQVLQKGWKWHQEEHKQASSAPNTAPDDIKKVNNSICKQILTCKETGKPYKIVPQELEFYKKMNLAIPQKSPDQRYKERLAKRNPRVIFNRTCAKCKTPIQTTYAPNRPETVYCEKCYLESVY